MKVIQKYRYWLNKCSKYFDISSDDILNTSKQSAYIVEARITFYYLCFKDKICLYTLSIELGKHRTTILSSLKNTKSNYKCHIAKLWKIK